MDGQRMAFAFEFENKPRSDGEDPGHGERPERFLPGGHQDGGFGHREERHKDDPALQIKIKKNEQEKWFVSDFGKATTLPFKEIWFRLDHTLSETGGDGEDQDGEQVFIGDEMENSTLGLFDRGFPHAPMATPPIYASSDDARNDRGGRPLRMRTSKTD